MMIEKRLMLRLTELERQINVYNHSIRGRWLAKINLRSKRGALILEGREKGLRHMIVTLHSSPLLVARALVNVGASRGDF
jgi:hypothetical protein